jgi:hypothetical protein
MNTLLSDFRLQGLNTISRLLITVEALRAPLGSASWAGGDQTWEKSQIVNEALSHIYGVHRRLED